MLRQSVIDDLDRIERQHASIRDAMFRMRDAIVSGCGEGELQAHRKAIKDARDAHMEFEEAVMVKYGYPLAAVHARQHQSCKDQIDAVLNSIGGKVVLLGDAAKLMKGVHEHHEWFFDEVFCCYLIDRFVIIRNKPIANRPNRSLVGKRIISESSAAAVGGPRH